MTTTFNYLTRAAKDRVLYDTYEGSPYMQIVAATLNVRSAPPFVPFKGYVGARQYIYMVQTDVSTFEIQLQNIFNDTYEDGLSPQQGPIFDLSKAHIAISDGSFRPDLPPTAADLEFSTYITALPVTSIKVTCVNGNVPAVPQDDSKLNVIVTLPRVRP
jgi:hypothetical protein